MTKQQQMIAEEVVATAKRIEALEDPFELEPLEVKVEASLDGTPRNIILVLTVGGPHIEVNATRGVVDGYWGGRSHSCHVNADLVLDELDDYYSTYWEENIIA